MKKFLLVMLTVLSLSPLLSGCFIYWDDWGGHGHGGHHDDRGGGDGGGRGRGR
ncbi:MAG: hypothetical protein AB1346_03465 [Thermodesulfobacteriota bacterium]